MSYNQAGEPLQAFTGTSQNYGIELDGTSVDPLV